MVGHSDSSSSSPYRQSVSADESLSVSGLLGEAIASAAEPVADVELERSGLADADERGQPDDVARCRRQSVHREGQHVGALRIADEQRALLVPLGCVVAQRCDPYPARDRPACERCQK